MTISSGECASLSGITCSNSVSSSCPIVDSIDCGLCDILITCTTFSTGTCILFAISSGLGSRPNSFASCDDTVDTLFIFSTM